MGSAFGYRHLASALAAAADACVLVPDYRLAPEHPFPAALEDAVRAYRLDARRRVPAERIVVAGDSAGGGLALSLLTTLKRQDLPLPGGTDAASARPSTSASTRTSSCPPSRSRRSASRSCDQYAMLRLLVGWSCRSPRCAGSSEYISMSLRAPAIAM